MVGPGVQADWGNRADLLPWSKEFLGAGKGRGSRFNPWRLRIRYTLASEIRIV